MVSWLQLESCRKYRYIVSEISTFHNIFFSLRYLHSNLFQNCIKKIVYSFLILSSDLIWNFEQKYSKTSGILGGSFLQDFIKLPWFSKKDFVIQSLHLKHYAGINLITILELELRTLVKSTAFCQIARV